MDGSSTSRETPLLLGIDVGSVNVKVALRAADGSLLSTVSVPCRGRPRQGLRDALKQIAALRTGSRKIRIGLTGGGHALVPHDLPRENVNEVVATARGVAEAHPGVRTVIDLGGQFSKWIVLEPSGGRAGSVIDFATNGLCAAGSGAFIEQQAGRLQLSIDELGAQAACAARGASIAGRCSVFAKSDMIHLQQKGTPVEEIAYGLCQTLARQFLTTVMAGREIEPPVVLVGGGAANAGLVRAFREALGMTAGQLRVAGRPLFAGALGAVARAAVGAETTVEELLAALEGAGPESGGWDGRTRSVLAPLEAARDDDEGRLEDSPAAEEAAMDAWLGVDVGSVSTNLVLLDRGLELIQGIYLRTRGRPVEVLHEGLSLIRRRFGDRVRVLGVGSTGSGRHLAARLLGADVVRNEITTQMVSATRFVPEVDTIFEIGGQDSKFVAVRDGRLADFEMNKICAAGTGSFLEEQAERLGIEIVGDFARKALAADCPVDLGSRCTVFMDTELVRAQERDEPVENLCAGLAYSVCRNYLEKVVAGRPIGRRIVFQGGTASNAAVVAAFRSLLGRPVRVHPYNRLSGALGAALLAAQERWSATGPSRFHGFDACESAEIRGFECGACDNRCQVNRVRLGDRVVHFGDVCEMFSEKDRRSSQRHRPFPELFAERETLLEVHLGPARRDDPEDARPRMGLLPASLNLEFLPFWTTFLEALGYRPLLAPRASPALFRTHPPGLPAELCLPVKSAASQARALLAADPPPRLFVPALLECPHPDGDQAHTCFYNQQLGDMLRVESGERVVTAQFALEDGTLGLVEPALALASALDRSVREVLGALASARAAQARFDAARRELGARALAAPFDRAAVVLGKPYNTHDPFLNLGLARLLDKLGIPAIPWDLLPLHEVVLDRRWDSVPWHYNRQQLRVLEIIRRDARLFPVLVSSYGCGPDAFVIKHIEEMLSGTPRLLLEFDEHRGEAGLQTRLEAFADEIEAHRSGAGRRSRADSPTPGSDRLPRGRRILLPSFSEHADVYAAVLRSAGWQAEVLPPVDEETIRIGEKLSSGRECHPHTILAGEVGRLLQQGGAGVGDVFLSLNCVTSCLLRQYGDSFRIMCERIGSRMEIWDATTRDLRQLVGTRGMLALYEGLLAVDILTTLSTRLRPYVRDPVTFSGLLSRGLDRLLASTEQREDLGEVLGRVAASLWTLARDGDPGDRPVVGVTGDLYTRINRLANAGLFARLERMGCEVWPSPFFAQISDLAAATELPRLLRRLRPRDALGSGLTRALTTARRRSLTRDLPDAVRDLALEPDAERLLEVAQRYVGPGTNHLILLSVAKIADFLSRGASGVINAAGINCMVGTAVASAVPRLRADFDQAPVVTLLYGGSEGPAQRIRLETFVHQVSERWQRRQERCRKPAGTRTASRSG